MSKSEVSATAFPPVPFPQARAVALRVLTAPKLAGRAFLEGGLVPWVVSGRESGWLHGDVDVSVRLEDMPAVRAWLSAEELYDPALDSLNLPCNERRADFGTHALVDGVLVSLCPYFFEGDELRQRSAALEMTDGFGALFEAVIPGLAEGDFVEMRILPDGTTIGCATLESVRAAKMAGAREKDVHDVTEIDRMGCDPGRCARVAAAYASMRLVRFAEGPCAQVMHVGPYDEEPATIAALTAFIAEKNLVTDITEGGESPEGHAATRAFDPEALLAALCADGAVPPIRLHHEIYLGDPRRISPERLRTVIRHPVREQ